MAFKMTREVQASLVSNGVVIGSQTQSAEMIMTVTSVSVYPDGTGTAYLDTAVNGASSGDVRSYPITWLNGDIFSQAQEQIMGLDEFFEAIAA
ncbi:hypothetical protein ACWASU_003769 [Klebsiella pneumoniae]|uniref:hypothetical protein n=1 Tax=Klebsiella pneumoniae TaxID=573 RepID=UPI0010347CBE|nr:hypothetical protein [Klebsiella pneumoniae]